jgi:hypothetical protein
LQVKYEESDEQEELDEICDIPQIPAEVVKFLS